jgi:hypothetical protein
MWKIAPTRTSVMIRYERIISIAGESMGCAVCMWCSVCCCVSCVYAGLCVPDVLSIVYADVPAVCSL